MKMFTATLLGLSMLTGFAFAADAEKEPETVHDFKMKSLDGKEVDFADYKGKVLLIVNTASKCGLTPQYEQLQAMHEQYEDKGLVILGFPCNQFGKQEPGDAKEIRSFCTKNYGVKFPMFSKIDVNGNDQDPLYAYLKENSDDNEDIQWNFEKFVVGKDGKVAKRFSPRVKPDAKEVVETITNELEEE